MTIQLKARVNTKLDSICKNLGGKILKDKTWGEFPDFVADKVAELDKLYNQDLVVVEVKALSFLRSKFSISFLGQPLAVKNDGGDYDPLDDDAVVGIGAALIAGKIEIRESDNSTIDDIAILEDTIFRFKMSRNLLEKFGSEEKDYFSFKVID